MYLEVITKYKGAAFSLSKKVFENLGYEPKQYDEWLNSQIIDNPFLKLGTDWLYHEKGVLVSDTAIKKLEMTAPTERGNLIRNYMIKELRNYEQFKTMAEKLINQ